MGLPLAACFALGASLAPTDAVAVGALSKNFSFPRRVMSVLQGEGLLNDASGIISFQIALVALDVYKRQVLTSSFVLRNLFTRRAFSLPSSITTKLGIPIIPHSIARSIYSSRSTLSLIHI